MTEIKAAKHLGQHFLIDERVIERLVDAIDPTTGDSIVEIGPGLGALTLPVLARCGAMRAIEFDRRVLQPLRAKAASIGMLELINDDILQVNLSGLVQDQALKLIGNLPYNLSSPIIFHCIEYRKSIDTMVFMLQKEVVERICATPEDKAYGRLSIMVQLYCATESLFDIAPDAFDPPPKVDSSVIRLTPREQPLWDIKDFGIFDRLVRQAFSQRRKMIRKSLKDMITSEELQQLGIDATARPETLSGEVFAQMANYLSACAKD